jgi:hypothetical protein
VALLALLGLRAPRAVGRAEIVDALWGEDPPDTAVNAVHVQVSALRRSLGRDVIVTAGDGYRLAGNVRSTLPSSAALARLGRPSWLVANSSQPPRRCVPDSSCGAARPWPASTRRRVHRHRVGRSRGTPSRRA